MSVATICLVIACGLPLLCAATAKVTGSFDTRRDNHDPRAWLAKQTGRSARANAAQANSWEALPIFAAGVLSAQIAHAPGLYIDGLAVAFIALRLVYIGTYLADLAAPRSLVWALGLAASLALFFTPLLGQAH